jgi:hypothetical protein
MCGLKSFKLRVSSSKFVGDEVTSLKFAKFLTTDGHRYALRGFQRWLRRKARQKTLDAIVTLLVRRTGAGNLRLKEGLAFGLVLGSLICRAFPVNFVRDDVDIDVFNLNCVPTLQYKLGARTSLWEF